jgi:hypothetical protein
MHPSYFLILSENEDESKQELVLSASTSEWLFNCNFWLNFNAKYETSFAQYEEERLSLTLVKSMIDSLTILRENLLTNNNQTIRFIYGWNEKKEPLYCEIKIDVTMNEIIELINLLKNASISLSDVYFQL